MFFILMRGREVYEIIYVKICLFWIKGIWIFVWKRVLWEVYEDGIRNLWNDII